MTGVSFDISRKSTGYVIWEDREPKKLGNICLPKGFLGEQVSLFRGKVLRVLPERLDWIAFEDARAVSKQHGMILFALTGLIHEIAWNRGVPMPGFAQSTVKKALTGSGKAQKSDMIQAAQERWPHLGIEDDEDDLADALGVGLAFWATQHAASPPATRLPTPAPRA